MSDTNLSDDMIKLVRYSIITIERDHEDILESNKEIIIDEAMDEESFAAWVVSRYDQQPNHRQLHHGARKYLRVPFEVVGRWAKQDRRYEEKQLKILEGIESALKNRPEIAVYGAKEVQVQEPGT